MREDSNIRLPSGKQSDDAALAEATSSAVMSLASASQDHLIASRELIETRILEADAEAERQQWIKQQENERTLRTLVVNWSFVLVGVQVLSTNALAAVVALGHGSMEEWAWRLYIGGSLGSVTAFGHLIIRYLFPERKAADTSLLHRRKPTATTSQDAVQ